MIDRQILKSKTGKYQKEVEGKLKEPIKNDQILVQNTKILATSLIETSLKTKPCITRRHRIQLNKIVDRKGEV